ncbi:hypothetical protein Tco_1575584 [Tanacetum coccineum]
MKTPFQLISGKVSSIGPSSSNGPSVMERNADFAEELAKLQRQEYEAKDAAARYGSLFSKLSAEILILLPGRDPVVFSHPAGTFQTSITSSWLIFELKWNTLNDFQSLTNVCKDNKSHLASSHLPIMMMIFSATLTYLEPAVEWNPVPSKGGHNSSSVSDSLGDIASPVSDKKQSSINPSLVKVLFIGYIQINKGTNLTEPLNGLLLAYLSLLGDTDKVEGIDYDEVFALKEVFVTQPLKALKFLTSQSMYTEWFSSVWTSQHLEPGIADCLVDDIIFGFKPTKDWCDEFDGVDESQDKYVKDMLTKFDMESVRTATTPYEAAKTKLKDESDPPVNVHLYRSMIGLLMYLTASRPDIMFAVSACSTIMLLPNFSSECSQVDFQVSKRATKKSACGDVFSGHDGLFHGSARRGQLWLLLLQKPCMLLADSCLHRYSGYRTRLLDYGLELHGIQNLLDKQSTICSVRKIHTNDYVVLISTKAFDGPRFDYLVVHIGMGIYVVLWDTSFLVFVVLRVEMVSVDHGLFTFLVPKEPDYSRVKWTKFVPAGSSSSVPADYVSAGHVLVPVDRDRIC